MRHDFTKYSFNSSLQKTFTFIFSPLNIYNICIEKTFKITPMSINLIVGKSFIIKIALWAIKCDPHQYVMQKDGFCIITKSLKQYCTLCLKTIHSVPKYITCAKRFTPLYNEPLKTSRNAGWYYKLILYNDESPGIILKDN